MNSAELETRQRIDKAMRWANSTRRVEIRAGAINGLAACLDECFDEKTFVIVADCNTFPAAGEPVIRQLENRKQLLAPFIFPDSHLYAETANVKKLEDYLKTVDANAIAVGSGTINDITKLASYHCDRPYVSVATAASVDGYAAFGASITHEGYKQTSYCPAPRAVIADLDIIAGAPVPMNAWGYADLLAKVPAGADWMIADALGVEKIDTVAWKLVQGPLHKLIADPAGVKNGDPQALCFLMEGLIMSGLAMQAAQSSRPGSGADHQFSHLWDMQHHTHNGVAPSHGFKVGIGALASMTLYDTFLPQSVDRIRRGIESIPDYWPNFAQIEKEIRQDFPESELAARIVEQSREKYIDAPQLKKRLGKLLAIWSDLKPRLERQIMDFEKFRRLLAQVGAPQHPTDIGISVERLRKSYRLAQYIRKRYTILDLLFEIGYLEECIDMVFDRKDYWRNDIPKQVISKNGTGIDES